MNGQWVWAFVPTLAPSSFSCDGPVPPPPFRTPMAPMAPMSMAMGPPGNMEWRPTPKKMPRNQGASAKVIVPKSIPIGKVNVPKPEAVPVEKVDVPKPEKVDVPKQEAVPIGKVDVPKPEAVPIGKVDVPTVAEEMLSQPKPVEEPSQEPEHVRKPVAEMPSVPCNVPEPASHKEQQSGACPNDCPKPEETEEVIVDDSEEEKQPRVVPARKRMRDYEVDDWEYHQSRSRRTSWIYDYNNQDYMETFTQDNSSDGYGGHCFGHGYYDHGKCSEYSGC